MGGLKVCEAGNPQCGLLTGKSPLLGPVAPLRCDICCSEAGFCPECKCLLCSGSIGPDETSGMGDRVQCLELIGGGAGICGHSAHLDCAINCRMAGVVGSYLDIEYLCRRCDRKMDLLPCASRLVQAASIAPSRVVAEKNLRLALKLVQGTDRPGAKSLEDIVRTTLEKAEEGGEIQLIVRELCSDALGTRRALARQGDAMECSPGPSKQAHPDSSASGQLHDSTCVKQEAATTEYNDGLPPYETLVKQYQKQVDSALEKLRKSQQEEFEAAKNGLTTQMHRILNLYQKLLAGRAQMLNETKGSEQSPQAVLEAFDRYMESAYQQLRSLKEERRHLDEMLAIGNGFGSVPAEQLREWFHWPI